MGAMESGTTDERLSSDNGSTDTGSVFNMATRDKFGSAYPEQPHILRHNLRHHELLTLDSLAGLAARLPEKSIEFNRGDIPIGVDGKPDKTGLTIDETIRHIARSDSWAVLKNIEQVTEYKVLLNRLLEEIRPSIESKTGRMLSPQGFIFISSPNAVTPYHFDPEHNILLQITGSKILTQLPAGDAAYAPDEVHESYHTGCGGRELKWQDDFITKGSRFAIGPGEAVYVPVMAPHFVKNGEKSSISLSITWRSEWSFAESDARAFNHTLRRVGLTPRPPGRWPATNYAKARCWRVLRKLRLGS